MVFSLTGDEFSEAISHFLTQPVFEHSSQLIMKFSSQYTSIINGVKNFLFLISDLKGFTNIWP